MIGMEEQAGQNEQQQQSSGFNLNIINTPLNQPQQSTATADAEVVPPEPKRMRLEIEEDIANDDAKCQKQKEIYQ